MGDFLLVAIGFVAGSVAVGFLGAAGSDLWAATKVLPRHAGNRYRAWRIQRLLNSGYDDADLKVWMLDENGERTLALLNESTQAAHERGVEKRKAALVDGPPRSN